MHQSPDILPPPDLDWRDEQPRSRPHDDVYNPTPTAELGAACARHTFLDGARLPHRWLHHPGAFTVAELGFGIGLNFLLTLHAWIVKPGPGWLSYLAVEHQPLTPDQRARALAAWPDLPARDTLTRQSPPPLRGTYRLAFPEYRAELILLHDDAAPALRNHDFAADAWYLDGFAPARNPDIWSDEVCQLVARRSRPGATLATYTAAGAVRRRLDDAGFDIRKERGFGPKAERITGVRRGDPDAFTPPRHAAIIGAGLAGVSTAVALAERGVQVTLIERHDEPATEASAIPRGLAHPYLTLDPTPKTTRLRTGLHHLRQLLAGLTDDPQVWRPCPVLHLAVAKRIERLLEALPDAGFPTAYLRAVDVDEARALAGWPVDLPGTFAESGLAVALPRFCQALLARATNVDVRTNREALHLERTPDGGHRVRTGDDVVADDADAVILANALDAQRLCDVLPPIRPAHGVVARLRVRAPWTPPRTAVCFGGYALPDADGIAVGGGYADEPDDAQGESLIAALATHVEGLAAADFTIKSAIPGARATTFDRTPVVGSIADGVYASIGHGSNGLMTAPLAGAMIASALTGGPLPVSDNTAHTMRVDRRPRRQPPR